MLWVIDSMITPRQIKAARVLLGWTQQDLADKAIVSINTISRIESSDVDTRGSTLRRVQAALEKGGVEFSWKGEGVRLLPEISSGSERKEPF